MPSPTTEKAPEELPEDDDEDVVLQDDGAPSESMRHAYTVALIAGIDVSAQDLEDFVAGGGLAGFNVLTAAEVAAAPEDEALAAEAAQVEEGAEIPPALLAAQLKNVLARPGPEEEISGDTESDDPAERLMCVEGGPRQFHLCFDFPKDMAVVEAMMAHPGLLDAVVLLAPCPADPDADAAEPEELSDEEKAERAEIRLAGQRREQLFQQMRQVCGEQRLGVNAMGDTVFTTALLAEEPRASLSAIARAVLSPVRARIEYTIWRASIPFVSTEPRPVDLRHYFHALSSVPPGCTSVPLVLNALLEQVSLLAGGGTTSTADADAAPARAERNRMLAALDAGIYALAAPLAPPIQRPAPARPSIPIYMAGDAQMQRLSEPSQTPADIQSLTLREEKVLAPLYHT